MIYILTDPGYNDSIWCRNFLSSLTEQLRRNRMTFGEVFDAVPTDAEAVFIIASDYGWTQSTVKKLNANGLSPILISNNTEHLSGCAYSSVSSDIYGSIRRLLSQIGERPTAIYGVNTHSLSDIGKVDALFSYSEGRAEKPMLFYFDVSLEDCFSSFLERGGSIEAVICTNDFSAVSLVRKLMIKDPARLKELAVYSLTGGTLSRYYRPYIRSLNIDYTPFGKAALHLYKMLQKHRYISGASMKVSWDVSTEVSIPRPIEIDRLPQVGNNFNSDSEICEMMALEKLLDSIDEVDRSILNGLLSGKSSAELTEDCYLTENAVKYRLKKLLATAGAADRATLVTLIKKYIDRIEKA